MKQLLFLSTKQSEHGRYVDLSFTEIKRIYIAACAEFGAKSTSVWKHEATKKMKQIFISMSFTLEQKLTRVDTGNFCLMCIAHSISSHCVLLDFLKFSYFDKIKWTTERKAL